MSQRDQNLWPKRNPRLWSGKQGDGIVKLLGVLPAVAATGSAETFLVLEETENVYRTLALFDCVSIGGALEFTIGK
ncbi:hypothetical protein NKI38_30360 [Mesorhizobium sp. M0621]|uniref:hypothetical protein n=1 Tax=Mesorhizobium sp. M0621 TaxID=2956974 RepID=UPI00333C34E0